MKKLKVENAKTLVAVERKLYFKNHLKKNKTRSESGITLIALVITIIVLIILAGIKIL